MGFGTCVFCKYVHSLLNVLAINLLTFCIGGLAINLAFQKPAAMSSVYSSDTESEDRFLPAGAVDDNFGTSWNVDLCPATEHGDMDPWWLVDLQGTFVIESVMITNRGDYYWERLHSFAIEIFNKNPVRCSTNIEPEICYNHSTPALGQAEIRNFTCYTPTEGRFVRIRKWFMVNQYEILTLCDVQVFCTKENGFSIERRFERTRGIRMISDNYETFSSTTLTACGAYCNPVESCVAFNYNRQLRKCELIVDPRFEDKTENTTDWSYYGSDLC